RCKFCYTAVDIAIGDVKRAIRSYGDIGWLVEMLAIQPCLALLADSHQQLAVVRKFQNLLTAAVRDPDVVIRINAESMRIQKYIRPPGMQQLSGFTVKNQNGRGLYGAVIELINPRNISSVENKDSVMRIDTNS